MTLGAMAAEQVFYGENSQGVSGDVSTRTSTAAPMVGVWAMGPDPVHDRRELERRRGGGRRPQAPGADRYDDHEPRRRRRHVRRRTRSAAVLSDPTSGVGAAQILGQAYVTAYALMATNKEAIEKIAETLAERKELTATR